MSINCGDEAKYKNSFPPNRVLHPIRDDKWSLLVIVGNDTRFPWQNYTIIFCLVKCDGINNLCYFATFFVLFCFVCVCVCVCVLCCLRLPHYYCYSSCETKVVLNIMSTKWTFKLKMACSSNSSVHIIGRCWCCDRPPQKQKLMHG